MTDEEKAIMKLLLSQDDKLTDIQRRQSWWLDLSSNVAGNAIWDGAVWLFSRLIRKL